MSFVKRKRKVYAGLSFVLGLGDSLNPNDNHLGIKKLSLGNYYIS